MFFFEKKNQKTFTSPPLPRSTPWPRSLRERPEIKVFLLLFLQKKKAFLFQFFITPLTRGFGAAVRYMAEDASET
jgi:hypothetical protein